MVENSRPDKRKDDTETGDYLHFYLKLQEENITISCSPVTWKVRSPCSAWRNSC